MADFYITAGGAEDKAGKGKNPLHAIVGLLIIMGLCVS